MKLEKIYWVHDESGSCGYTYSHTHMESHFNDPYVAVVSKEAYQQRVSQGYEVAALPKPRHVMIDLETMGKTPQHAIVSIGAIIFDPRTGFIADNGFYMELDWSDQDRPIDKSTEEWWSNQSEEARSALNGLDDLQDALILLSEYLPSDCRVWGNGATFDISFLEDAYRQQDVGIPWKFWNVRDCRTIKDIYESSRGGLDNQVGPKQGIKHNALHDAVFQAQYVNLMWNSILGD